MRIRPPSNNGHGQRGVKNRISAKGGSLRKTRQALVASSASSLPTVVFRIGHNSRLKVGWRFDHGLFEHLDQPVPFTLLLNAPTLVSTMIQVTHSLVHHELDAIPDILNTMPEASLRRYIEGVLREPSLEDQLCGCLTLAEQAQLFAMSVPQEIVHHLATWLQTYLSNRLRRDLLSG